MSIYYKVFLVVYANFVESFALPVIEKYSFVFIILKNSFMYFAKKVKGKKCEAISYRRLSTTVAVVSSYGGYDIFYHRRLVHVLHLLLVSLFMLSIHIRFSLLILSCRVLQEYHGTTLLILSRNFGELFILLLIEKKYSLCIV